MPERYLGQYLGRFRIDTIVGSGGFAWVYRGYDPELEIPVAVKVLKPQFAGDATFEERFRREANTAAKLRHPNIVRILAVGREGSAVYFVMDYLPHGLVERLRLMGTFPESLLIRLGMDVASALGFAHREGVIHRDIKTDNILFDEHGNAIVADFGIARAVSGYIQQTGTNMVVGTPQYFSPEQARGQVLDGRADIYALGVTLFKAGTGVLPFQGDDWYDIARRHIEELPPKPRSYNPSLSREIERVILCCLEKEPANRYPTAEALHAELLQQLGRAGASSSNDRTIVMRTPNTGGDRVTPMLRSITEVRRRRRGWAILAAGAMGVLALALAVSLHPSEATLPPAKHAVLPAATHSGPAAAERTRDSAGRDTAARFASAAVRPPPVPPTLHVVAPAEAVISMNGRKVGRGEWKSSGIVAGVYRVRASLPGALALCASAADSATARVNEQGVTTVRLTPRHCGQFAVDARPAGAEFILTGDAKSMSGKIPLHGTVMLPVGQYRLHVAAPECADFNVNVTIQAGKTHQERVRLLCR